MNAYAVFAGVGLAGVVLAGCATTPRHQDQLRLLSSVPGEATIHPASHVASGDQLTPPEQLMKSGLPSSGPLDLRQVTDLSLERHPRLAQVTWAIEAARGRAVQAGLYPNPTVNITGNELGDRTGPSGIWSALASQEIVTANKLGLSQAVAEKEVDQATLNLVAERFRVLTEVRQAFYEVLALQKRTEVLAELVKLAEQSVENAQKLLRAKEAAELDIVQLEVDLERYRAEMESTQRSLPASYRRLAASMGVQDINIPRLIGDLNAAVPDYELDQVRNYILTTHPEVRAAEIEMERARLVLQRAEVEPVSNITVAAGYTHQGQNRSNDWDIGVSLPLPLWNKNQGNIMAARAQVSEAEQLTGKVQNDLVVRLSTAFSAYASAKRKVDRYQGAILPKAEKTYQLSLKAYQGGQFEYLRVLQAQRSMAETRLELVRSQSDMWQAVSALAGMMLDDQWQASKQQERKQP
jgi:outer membrane protein, heavy metal efflux system